MISTKVTRVRFDSATLLNYLSKGEIKALSKIGAFIWKTAKTSIRPRNRVSEPGSPPSSHVGILRDSIQFAFDTGTRSVVIGPKASGSEKVGNILEFGGTVNHGGTRHIVLSSGRGKRAKLTVIKTNGNFNYKPRPFMGPALTAELAAGTIPSAFASALSR